MTTMIRRPVGPRDAAVLFPTVCMALALWCVTAPAPAGQNAESDCRPHPVHADTEEALLTREEKIALMDRAFHDSLARFGQCRDATSAYETGGASTSRGAAGDGQRADGVQGADNAQRGRHGHESGGVPGAMPGKTPGAAMESVAASDMRGTDAPVSDAPSSDRVTSGVMTSGGGPLTGDSSEQLPEDILALTRKHPGPDNDSRLEAQIRLAAMAETDPEKKARLWNEYRRYKGLPLKPFVHAQGDSDDETPSN